jgi:predicted N-acetyltransferase YhbS
MISRSEFIILYRPKEDPNNIVGTVRVHTLNSDTADFGFLAVAKEEQGKGLGKTLVEAAKKMGRDLGYKTI